MSNNGESTIDNEVLMQVLPSLRKSSETLSTDVDDTNTNNKPTAPPRVKSGSSLKSDTNSRPNTAHNNK